MADHDNIDSVKIDTDERGFQLIIETEDGERHLFPLPSGASGQLVKETEPIREHLAEVAEYRREFNARQVYNWAIAETNDALQHYEYTGDDEPLRALADVFNKARRER